MQRPRVLKGQSLIEIMLAITVFLFGVVTIGVLYLDANVSQRKSLERAKANALAEEGIEAIRSMRDRSFDSVATGTHGLLISGGRWTFSGSSDAQEGYTRTLLVSAPDSNTLYVTSTVSWLFSPTRTETVVSTAVITNWRRVSPATWADPEIVSSSTLTNIAANAVDVYGDYLYVTTPLNAAGTELQIFDISNPISPVYRGGTETGMNLFVLDAYDNRVYIAGDSKPAETKIIDVSNPTNPYEIGSIKMTANEEMNAVFASGTIVHLGRDEVGNQATYFIYDTTNAASPQELGSINTGDDIYAIAVKNGATPYSFIGSENSSKELQIVNVADPSTMSVVGSVNLNEELRTVAVSGTLAFGGTEQNSDQPEFFVFSVSDPAHPSVIGSFEINANVNKVRVFNNLVFLATASSTAEFITLDVTNPTIPLIYGTFNLAGTATDISLSQSGLYAYVSTQSATAGLYILQVGTK
ncbi:MAG: hypothetical protein AAB386_05395 [Patescibacteria group bacterium]